MYISLVMEDIGFLKQDQMWLQSKNGCYSLVSTVDDCFRYKIGIFNERILPIISFGCPRLKNCSLSFPDTGMNI